MNQLKQFKSKVEGSYFTFQPIVLDKQLVTALKHSVVAFTPKTLSEQAKQRIVDQLSTLLEGQVRKVLYACLLTCSWFASTQDEVSAKAKNNILFVVYVARDEHFFSLATQHEKELCEVCEEVSFVKACEYRSLTCVLYFSCLFVLWKCAIFVSSCIVEMFDLLKHSVVHQRALFLLR